MTTLDAFAATPRAVVHRRTPFSAAREKCEVHAPEVTYTELGRAQHTCNALGETRNEQPQTPVWATDFLSVHEGPRAMFAVPCRLVTRYVTDGTLHELGRASRAGMDMNGAAVAVAGRRQRGFPGPRGGDGAALRGWVHTTPICALSWCGAGCQWCRLILARRPCSRGRFLFAEDGRSTTSTN